MRLDMSQNSSGRERHIFLRTYVKQITLRYSRLISAATLLFTCRQSSFQKSYVALSFEVIISRIEVTLKIIWSDELS